jgi:hypothetical protein
LQKFQTSECQQSRYDVISDTETKYNNNFTLAGQLGVEYVVSDMYSFVKLAKQLQLKSFLFNAHTTHALHTRNAHTAQTQRKRNQWNRGFRVA